MSGTVLIRGARQLVTLRGSRGARRGAAAWDLGIVQDGAVLIEDGRIVEVGPSRRVENLAGARRAHEVDATGCVVMPGFVDCHTHVVSGFPELASPELSEQNAGPWHFSPEAPGFSPGSISAKRLERGARHCVEEMIRHGTTTVGARSGYGLDEATELKILRVEAGLHAAPLDIVPTLMSPRVIPDEFKGDASNYISWLCSELVPRIQRRGLVRFAEFYCASGVFSLNEGNCYLEGLRHLGLPLKIYAGRYETEEALRLAVAVGAISIDHLERPPREGLGLLARSNTTAVLLPGPALYEGGPDPSTARSLMDAGVAVALGTNFNPARSTTYNMQTIVALACARFAMTPAEAICAATYNSAHALGCGDEAGSLEPGKAGDIIILNVDDYREIAYRFGVNAVRATLKRGSLIYEHGQIGDF